jgi:peptide/nickel transport system permease protein
MDYSGKIVRRALQSVPVLFGLSVLIFIISRVFPGNPVRLALGPAASAEEIQRVRESMGLNEPLWAQYADWAVGVAQGQWGTSLRTGNNVFHDVVVKLPATLELVLASLFLAIVVAIPLGVVAAENKDRLPDHVSRLGALFGVSMPRFWVAIVFQIIFVAWFDLFPLTGRLSNAVAPPPHLTGLYLVDSAVAGQFGTFVDALSHIALPATALSLATLAQVMRLIRSDMIEISDKEFIVAAEGYGLPKKVIQYKYMLKNAFTSSLTLIGLEFGFLIGNAFLVEKVFAWPGMASYGVDAILYQDFNAIVGVTMVVGVTYLLANLAVDLLYSYLDPRLRHQGAES